MVFLPFFFINRKTMTSEKIHFIYGFTIEKCSKLNNQSISDTACETQINF